MKGGSKRKTSRAKNKLFKKGFVSWITKKG